MKFLDTYVSKDQRFSIGTEMQSGRHYLSIPVSNSALITCTNVFETIML